MKILIANESVANKINQLRLKAYTQASNATILDMSYLHWNKDDNSALVLYIENEQGLVISSMRARVIYEKISVENEFDIRIKGHLTLPALILDRASTDISYRGHRLTAIFRHCFIKACLNSSVQNILTTVNEGALRIPIMESVGYQFSEADISHRTNSVYDNKTKVLLGKIPRVLFPKAARVSKEILKYDLRTFQIEDDFNHRLSEYMNRKIEIES